MLTLDWLRAEAEIPPATGGRVSLTLTGPDGFRLELRITGRDCRKLARLLTRAGADSRWEEVVSLPPQTSEEG